jgi:hypothetical protein
MFVWTYKTAELHLAVLTALLLARERERERERESERERERERERDAKMTLFSFWAEYHFLFFFCCSPCG